MGWKAFRSNVAEWARFPIRVRGNVRRNGLCYREPVSGREELVPWTDLRIVGNAQNHAVLNRDGTERVIGRRPLFVSVRTLRESSVCQRAHFRAFTRADRMGELRVCAAQQAQTIWERRSGLGVLALLQVGAVGVPLYLLLRHGIEGWWTWAMLGGMWLCLQGLVVGLALAGREHRQGAWRAEVTSNGFTVDEPHLGRETHAWSEIESLVGKPRQFEFVAATRGGHQVRIPTDRRVQRALRAVQRRLFLEDLCREWESVRRRAFRAAVWASVSIPPLILLVRILMQWINQNLVASEPPIPLPELPAFVVLLVLPWFFYWMACLSARAAVRSYSERCTMV